MKFIIVLALFAVVAARPNKPEVGDKLQVIREKLAKLRDLILNRPIHIGAEPIDFDFDPTYPAVEDAPTPVSSPLVQIIVNVQGSDSGIVTSPVTVEGIEHPSPVEFVEESEIYPTPVVIVEEAEDSHIEATPVIVVEDAEDSHIEATPVIIVEDAEDSEIHPEQVIVVDHSHEELEPVEVAPIADAPIIAAPAIMAPEVLN